MSRPFGPEYRSGFRVGQLGPCPTRRPVEFSTLSARALNLLIISALTTRHPIHHHHQRLGEVLNDSWQSYSHAPSRNRSLVWTLQKETAIFNSAHFQEHTCVRKLNKLIYTLTRLLGTRTFLVAITASFKFH